MARLGYLFLVAALGFTVLGPALAEAGERDGLKGYAARHIDKPVKHAPIRDWDDRKPGHHPRHWRQRGDHHPRHWRNRYWGHPPRHWRHGYRPPVRHFYAPPPMKHYRRDHRDYRPYRYYSNEAGTIDFNINYRLFF